MSQALSEPFDPGFMDVDEFYAWAEVTDGRWQLVDGVPEAMAPVSNVHALIHAEFARLLGNHLDTTKSECMTAIGPGVTPRVDAKHNVRVPDILVSCDPADRYGRTFESPVLIVEILSPGNRAQTWRNVWSFTTIPSVQEIIVLHTLVLRASVLVRGFDNSWPDVPTEVKGGDVLRVESLGFAVALAEIYDGTGLVEI